MLTPCVAHQIYVEFNSEDLAAVFRLLIGPERRDSSEQEVLYCETNSLNPV